VIFCPCCGRELKVITQLYKVPYFDDVLLMSFTCECGFKHAETLVTKIGEPTRFKIRIKGDNLNARVIKSSSGTIRIPELGINIEPGPTSQAFITNVEGILHRVKDVVKSISVLHKDDANVKRKCDEIIKKIDETIEGKDELTLIIDDPFGNSLIISNDAVKEKIRDDELKNLKTGLVVFELMKHKKSSGDSKTKS